MEKRLLEFVNMLRGAGIKITPTEVTDCLKALEYFGVADPRDFYRIAASTLIKSETDMPVFNLGFRLFFFQEQRVVMPELGCTEGNQLVSVTGEGQGKAGMGAKSRQLYAGIKGADTAFLISMVREAMLTLKLENQSLDELIREAKVRLEWFMVENAFEREGTAGNEGQTRLKELETFLRHSIEHMVVERRGNAGLAEILDQVNLRTKELAALNMDQVKEMEKRIERLAKKLAARYSYRLKPAKTGLVDMRRVLQRTAHRGITPDKLLFQDKALDKPRIVILCDISGSVAVYSAFLLQLVYAMTRRFREIRTFLYVDEISEATPELKRTSVREAVAQAIQKTKCSRIGISNFGQVFEIFNNNYSYVLCPKTTLLILGDAKNNWFPPKADVLQNLAGKVKKLYWLNPEPKSNWNKEDSIIALYERYCTEVMECRNLEQLETAIRRII